MTSRLRRSISEWSCSVVRPVGRTGQVRLRLPRGVALGTLLMLRRDDDWLDFRSFSSATPGRDGDASVVWDLPGAQVGVLVAGGEGLYVEFKREVPAGESRNNMLKTVAAFASGEGGHDRGGRRGRHSGGRGGPDDAGTP